MSTALFLLPLAAAAQGPVLQIQVLAGDGAHHRPGVRAANFLNVKVTDELGKPVAGAVVSFRLPEDGPGGTFSNGLRTEVVTTAQDGLAQAPPVRWNSVPGGFEVRVVAAWSGSRAGTVVPVYLSDEAGPGNGLSDGRTAIVPSVRPKARSRWLVVGLTAAGAAAVGFTAAWARGPRAEAPKGAEPPRVGTPVIGVGRP